MEIELFSRGKGHKCLIDEEDLDLFKKFKWYIHHGKKKYSIYLYAFSICNGVYQFLQFHRMIMNCPSGFVVDHINHNGLDNRKINLRICKQSENRQNCYVAKSNSKSGIRGVFFNKSNNKWTAMIRLNGKYLYDKDFNSAHEAKLAIEKTRKQLLPYYV